MLKRWVRNSIRPSWLIDSWMAQHPCPNPSRRTKTLPFQREKSKASLQVSSLKNDCSPFSRLYIACQTQDGNIQDLFHHENQPCPPSLSQLSKLRLGTKADLMGSGLESCTTDVRHDAPDIDVIIIDGTVVVNFLKPVAAKTFDEYALKVFLPYIQSQLHHVCRADIVWDQYIENSLHFSISQMNDASVDYVYNSSVPLTLQYERCTATSPPRNLILVSKHTFETGIFRVWVTLNSRWLPQLAFFL